jgi:antitoxin MazE
MLGISLNADRAITHVMVGRWGKNLAVRLPGDIARAVGLAEGQRVEIETRDGEVILRGPAPDFTLDQLFRRRTPAEWRADYANAYDWGPDVGRERVEE